MSGLRGSGAVGSNYGFLTFLTGPRGCIRNTFAKVELKCNLAAAIAWLEFEQDGREVAAERGLKPEHQGHTRRE